MDVDVEKQIKEEEKHLKGLIFCKYLMIGFLLFNFQCIIYDVSLFIASQFFMILFISYNTLIVVPNTKRRIKSLKQL